MEVQDMSGKKLIDLAPGKSKGINIVTWNGLIKQPKIAKGKTLATGGFTSPRVPAGTYKVVMTKGKDTFETTITLQNDPKSALTIAERAANNATTAKLYSMTQELAYLVYEMDEVLSKAEEVAKNGGDKAVADLIKEITALKETLVITTGDNYVASAEPQLREKIADLYSKVASGFEAPSSSEMENMTLLQERFEKAKLDFSVIKSKKLGKMERYMDGNGITKIVIKSYEAFINNN